VLIFIADWVIPQHEPEQVAQIQEAAEPAVVTQLEELGL
jgi:hypothetical protein